MNNTKKVFIALFSFAFIFYSCSSNESKSSPEKSLRCKCLEENIKLIQEYGKVDYQPFNLLEIRKKTISKDCEELEKKAPSSDNMEEYKSYMKNEKKLNSKCECFQDYKKEEAKMNSFIEKRKKLLLKKSGKISLLTGKYEFVSVDYLYYGDKRTITYGQLEAVKDIVSTNAMITCSYKPTYVPKSMTIGEFGRKYWRIDLTFQAKNGFGVEGEEEETYYVDHKTSEVIDQDEYLRRTYFN